MGTYAKAYAVEFKLHSCGEIQMVSFLANNKEEAYDKAVYEEIPKVTGEYPYSAWVKSVTYNNGRYRVFNTHEGKPY